MLARAKSVAIIGLDGHPVDVEVSITQGLPSFTIVGLPDLSVQEARERVRAAIQNSREAWPQQRITVNLSPAHLRKAGSGFDLAIAVGILAASGRVAADSLERLCVLGELSLDGSVRPVRGALAASLAARAGGESAVVVPRENALEAALVGGIDVVPVTHLTQAVGFLRGETAPLRVERVAATNGDAPCDLPDLSEVRSQDRAKRALEIAATGGHNLLMVGTPGGGKTMLARRLPGILPKLGEEEALEVTRIYSVAGLLGEVRGLVKERPFRAPHHSISTAGLVGGGSGLPSPGEVSLAHRGVLFLDEASLFRRDALQALRAPIEDGWVSIVRARFAVTYPARFQLVAAANPCPCGNLGDEHHPCECPPGRVASYRERLSGPILDRMDVQVEVPRLARGEIFKSPVGETSERIRHRVEGGRRAQTERLRSFGLSCNADVPPRLLPTACRRTPGAQAELERAIEVLALTGRGAHRLVRTARTIADLAGADTIAVEHVVEAASFRLT